MKKILLIFSMVFLFLLSCDKQKTKPEAEELKDGKELFLASIKNANEWSEFSNPSSANFKKRKPSIERQIPGVVDMTLSVPAYDSAGGRWHNATVIINSVGAGYEVVNVNSIHRPTAGNMNWRSGYWWLDYYRCTAWSQTLPDPPYSILMPVAGQEEWFGSVTVMNSTTCQEVTAGEYITTQ